MKPTLNAPGTKRLKLNMMNRFPFCYKFALKFNLCRYDVLTYQPPVLTKKGPVARVRSWFVQPKQPIVAREGPGGGGGKRWGLGRGQGTKAKEGEAAK
jgi:hypothetical protein